MKADEVGRKDCKGTWPHCAADAARGALILAADTGAKLAPDLQEYFRFVHSAAWGVAPLILLVAGAIILIGSQARTQGTLGTSH